MRKSKQQTIKEIKADFKKMETSSKNGAFLSLSLSILCAVLVFNGAFFAAGLVALIMLLVVIGLAIGGE